MPDGTVDLFSATTVEHPVLPDVIRWTNPSMKNPLRLS